MNIQVWIFRAQLPIPTTICSKTPKLVELRRRRARQIIIMQVHRFQRSYIRSEIFRYKSCEATRRQIQLSHFIRSGNRGVTRIWRRRRGTPTRHAAPMVFAWIAAGIWEIPWRRLRRVDGEVFHLMTIFVVDDHLYFLCSTFSENIFLH